MAPACPVICERRRNSGQFGGTHALTPTLGARGSACSQSEQRPLARLLHDKVAERRLLHAHQVLDLLGHPAWEEETRGRPQQGSGNTVRGRPSAASQGDMRLAPAIRPFTSRPARSSTSHLMGKEKTPSRSLGMLAISCLLTTAGSATAIAGADSDGLGAAAAAAAAAGGTATFASRDTSAGGCSRARTSSSEYLRACTIAGVAAACRWGAHAVARRPRSWPHRMGISLRCGAASSSSSPNGADITFRRAAALGSRATSAVSAAAATAVDLAAAIMAW